MATSDTEALGGIQEEKISERSCGITKTHRRILPCIGAVIIVRITKLEGSVLSHGCCYRIIVIMPCQFHCFEKSLSDMELHKQEGL
jgi:hypothetical protein